MCASSCLSSSTAKVTSTVYFILLIKSLGSFLNTSLGINIPSLPWFHWQWSLWSHFQTLHWDNHSFLTLVSLAILKVIKEVLILKLKAYWFVNDVVCFQLFIIIGCQSNINSIFCIADKIFGVVFKYFFEYNYSS